MMTEAVPGQFDAIDRDRKMTSLKPTELLAKLNLDAPGLEAVRQAAEAGDRDRPFAELLAHYRRKYPPGPRPHVGADVIERADKICRHILQWGPYEEADYGPDIDWAWDPRGDIEWVASMYRFAWADPLAQAYRATGDEKYPAAFVELATDWIRKHPLEQRQQTHPVYTKWNGYVWLDIQTGVRATNICSAFTALLHGQAFSPDFLRLLMASLYDHQQKTMWLPMGSVHNKAVFEQRGFINIAYHFSEFADSHAWMTIAIQRAAESFLLQTTCDGVQREWSFGYHLGVLRDAVEIQGRMAAFGIAIPQAFTDRIRLCYDYIFAIAAPDLGGPLFGDGKRPLVDVNKDPRPDWPLYPVLKQATRDTGDPKYAARADLDLAALPKPAGHAFTHAGMYVMRSGWSPDAIHLALHCSPKAISSHDQPDNGTFELYAYGRWLMPDTGFYTYGHDPEGRRWHRQTQVHQTLTLDGLDSADAGRHLLWRSDDRFDAVVVENSSYDQLTHRRSIWFVDRAFLVLLDEAIGQAAGQLDLHFQFAPGAVTFDPGRLRAHTSFDDANVLVAAGEGVEGVLHEQDGWFAWAYGQRLPRKAMRLALRSAAPTAVATAVVPYRGTAVPDIRVRAANLAAGDERVELTVQGFEKTWRIGRDLRDGSAWCELMQ